MQKCREQACFPPWFSKSREHRHLRKMVRKAYWGLDFRKHSTEGPPHQARIWGVCGSMEEYSGHSERTRFGICYRLCYYLVFWCRPSYGIDSTQGKGEIWEMIIKVNLLLQKVKSTRVTCASISRQALLSKRLYCCLGYDLLPGSLDVGMLVSSFVEWDAIDSWRSRT